MKLKRQIDTEKWVKYPYRLAHHPLCDKFENHVYTIKGYKICRGCTNLYSGMFVGLIAIPFITILLHLNYWAMFAVTWGLYLFTPLTIIIKFPRIVKDFARFLLGIGLVSVTTTVILGIIALIKYSDYWGLIIAVISIIIYVVSKTSFTKIRERRNAEICLNCEYFRTPECAGMKPARDRAIGLSALAKGDAFSENSEK